LSLKSENILNIRPKYSTLPSACPSEPQLKRNVQNRRTILKYIEGAATVCAMGIEPLESFAQPIGCG